jgi:hypothetical protein
MASVTEELTFFAISELLMSLELFYTLMGTAGRTFCRLQHSGATTILLKHAYVAIIIMVLPLLEVE